MIRQIVVLIALLASGVSGTALRAEGDVNNLCRPYFKSAIAEAQKLTGITTPATYIVGSYKLYLTEGQITDRGCDFTIRFAFERAETQLQLIWADHWALQRYAMY